MLNRAQLAGGMDYTKLCPLCINLFIYNVDTLAIRLYYSLPHFLADLT